MRHTAATWLMQAIVDVWKAGDQLGMSAATLGKHYGHLMPDHQASASRAFGAAQLSGFLASILASKPGCGNKTQ
jgi:hypothetical protein